MNYYDEGYYTRAKALNSLFHGYGDPNQGQMASMPNSVQAGVLSESTAKGIEGLPQAMFAFENGVPTKGTLAVAMNPGLMIGRGLVYGLEQALSAIFGGKGVTSSQAMSLAEALNALGMGDIGGDAGSVADAAGLAAALGASQGTGIL